jgi:hypothetical protein
MNYQEINEKKLPHWQEALKHLTTLLTDNNVKYYLSASGREYILGSNRYPYDIDLFMSRENVTKAYEFLEPLATSNLHEWDGRYLEFQGMYNAIPFEICEWEEEPKLLINKKVRDFQVSIIG